MYRFISRLFCSIDLCVCFMPILFYCSFVIWFESKECEAPSFVLLSEGCFGYSESCGIIQILGLFILVL